MAMSSTSVRERRASVSGLVGLLRVPGLFIVMVAAVGACSTDSQTADDRRASTQAGQTPATEVPSAAEAALERYVEAINRGDTSSAMDLRCADATVPDDQVETFERDAAALIDAVGPLRIASVEPVPELAPVDGLMRYTFEGHEGALTIAEDGEDGFCFWRPAASYDLQRQLDPPIDPGETAVPAEQLLPTSVGDGYELVPTPAGGDSSSSAPEQVSRSWQPSSFGGVTVTAGTYPDVEAALADAALLLDETAAAGVAEVELVGTPEVRAVRSLGYAWLWVQPPSVGPFIDRAVMPFGRVLVTVQVSGPDAAAVDAQLAAVTADVAARARPKS
jgi:hypothetical protein